MKYSRLCEFCAFSPCSKVLPRKVSIITCSDFKQFNIECCDVAYKSAAAEVGIAYDNVHNTRNKNINQLNLTTNESI